MFKRHRYPRVVILHAVYLKLRFTLSYRDVGSSAKVGEEYRLNDFLCVLKSRNGRIFRLIEIDFTCNASRAF
jgi:hypothetical protein